MLARLGRCALRLALASALLLGAGALVVPAKAKEPWRSGTKVGVRYQISAGLHRVDDGFKIRGHQTVHWRNDSQDQVSVLYLHLYPNAFLDRRSSFLREMARGGRTLDDDTRFGGLDIRRITTTGGVELTYEYVSPDDGNPHDTTVARVPLPSSVGPVAPGRTISVDIAFTTRLPDVIARMGAHEGFVMAAQWYPKLGRYEGLDSGKPNLREGWYCHQFHHTTEFYADFADYDVELKIPADMVVGATGERREPSSPPSRDDVRVHRFEARGVVDFAWTAHADFERYEREILPADPALREDAVSEERRRLKKILGLTDEDLALPPVKVVLLLQPQHAGQKDRHFEAARVALGMYGLWFGPYPYKTLTIVDPAFGARAGGMEYPQLVTAGTSVGSPAETLNPEHVIVHEIGHQWFMNLLASNEAEEAWLDEGLNTYFTGYFMDLRYGPALRSSKVLGAHVLETNFHDFAGLASLWPGSLGLPEWATPPEMSIFRAWRDLPPLTGLRTPRYVDDFAEIRRPSYMRRTGWDPMVQPGWEFVDRRSYGSNVYSRAALFVNTLRRRAGVVLGAEAGEAAFAGAMRAYARKYRFGHPTTSDFLTTFAAASGMDPEPLARALVLTSGDLDYAVESIRTFEEPRDPDAPEPSSDGPPSPSRSEVVVRRRGEAAAPTRLEVRIETDDGGQLVELREWDGRDRWRRFRFDGKVLEARLDPDRAYLQDLDRTNDSRTAEGSARPAFKWSVRFMLWLENALLSYGRFF